LREVTHTAVKQSARATARAEGEIVLLNQADAQPAHRSVANDSCTDDSAADY
jgi:hypothetical protein